jgi:hypothetical protein
MKKTWCVLWTGASYRPGNTDVEKIQKEEVHPISCHEGTEEW